MTRFLVYVSLLVLSGCAAFTPPPPAPQHALTKSSKVGLLVTLDPEIEHRHVGTTVFNNFDHPAQLPWDLKVRVQTAFTKSLTEAGLDVVDLQAAGLDSKALAQLVIQKDKEWIVNPEAQSTLNRLHNELGLDAIVNVSQSQVRVRNECTQFGCAETYMNKSGLFTRGFMLSTTYFSVPAFYVSAYRLSEPSNLSVYEPLRGKLASDVKMLKNFPDPKDLRQLTDEEFIPVADSLATTVDELSDATAKVLAVSAVLP